MALEKREWIDEIVIGKDSNGRHTGAHTKTYEGILDDGVLVSHTEKIAAIKEEDISDLIGDRASLLAQLTEEIELRKAAAAVNTQLDAEIVGMREKIEAFEATVKDQSDKLKEVHAAKHDLESKNRDLENKVRDLGRKSTKK